MVSAMKKLWGVIKKHQDLLAYSVLSVLLFCACFFSPFAWITAGYAVLLALLWRQETKTIGLILFLDGFYALFYYQKLWGLALNTALARCLMLILFGIYLFRVFKREQKLNWKTLIPIALFLVYVILPFHEWNWGSFATQVFFLLFLYVAFESRKRINCRYVVRVFVVGLIISCVFALFRTVSPLLNEKIWVRILWGTSRFGGLTYHPNILARLIMLAICALFILKHKKQISLTEFLVGFVTLFVFGYLTLSRAFIIATIVGIVTFATFDLLRYKVKALPFLGLILVIMCVIGGIFFNTTKIYLERFPIEPASSYECNFALNTANLDELFVGKSEQWKQDVFAGKVHFDPGRSGLREMYLNDWASSPQTIWLGRGVARPAIGQMAAHNLWIQELWEHGIVGYLLYALIVLSSIKWKKLKQVKHCLAGLIIFIPYFLTTLVEPCLNDYIQLTFVIICFSCLEQLFEKHKIGCDLDD